MNLSIYKNKQHTKLGEILIRTYLSNLRVPHLPLSLQKITFYLIDGITNHEHTVSNLQKRLSWQYDICRNQFKQYTGFTPKQFITHHRIELAKQLLSKTELQIGDIATLLGYEQPHALTMRFQKIVGMSPIAYRQKIKSEMKSET